MKICERHIFTYQSFKNNKNEFIYALMAITKLNIKLDIKRYLIQYTSLSLVKLCIRV